MMKKPGLGARLMLAAIGGMAAMVAGVKGHYHADYQTPKKNGNRSRTGRGKYGRYLRAHFDGQNATPERLATHKAHLAHMAAKKQQRALAAA